MFPEFVGFMGKFVGILGRFVGFMGQFVGILRGSLVFRAVRWNIERFVGLSFIRARHGKKSSQALES